MLHNVGSLFGASVLAKDGEIGRIFNLLFDDQSWMIRYLAVDVRRWLTRRDVLVAVTALAEPDFAALKLPCTLTREQVRHSPDVDSQMPVSRQQEVAMREFYGWPAYWSNPNQDSISIPVTAGRQFPALMRGDQHLRSTEALTGYRVWAGLDELGTLHDFIFDEGSWHIGYLDIQTGDWLRKRSVLIPTNWVNEISWADHRIELHRSGAELRGRGRPTTSWPALAQTTQ